jgi:Txe/YoeB family toxin of toxin-antitoxin system
VEVVFTLQAEKDFKEIQRQPVLFKKVIALLDLIERNPFEVPPRYEKLVGLPFVYSRRINQQHRLVYQWIEAKQTIKVIRMWTHYQP